MTLIFRSLICHCPRRGAACGFVLRPDADVQEYNSHRAPPERRDRIHGKRTNIFLRNQNMAGAIGSVYWYVHK